MRLFHLAPVANYQKHARSRRFGEMRSKISNGEIKNTLVGQAPPLRMRFLLCYYRVDCCCFSRAYSWAARCVCVCVCASGWARGVGPYGHVFILLLRQRDTKSVFCDYNDSPALTESRVRRRRAASCPALCSVVRFVLFSAGSLKAALCTVTHQRPLVARVRARSLSDNCRLRFAHKVDHNETILWLV